MKIYSNAHKKALELKNNMDNITREHEKFLEKAEKQNWNKSFDAVEAGFNRAEDEAYAKYYNHMHRSLSLTKDDTTFLDKKYKEGFADEKYINDMFRLKAKKQKKVQHGHKQIKRKSR